MNTIRAIIRNGCIEPKQPLTLPEGTEVEVAFPDEPQFLVDIEFMTEEQQGDDPESIRRWLDALQSLPPVPEELKRECEPTEWDERMKQFNLETMRKQFAEGTQ